MEVPGVISDDGPGNTSRKSPMFSSSNFLPSINKTPNIYVTPVIPRRSPRITPKSLMIPSLHNSDNLITTNLSSNKRSNDFLLTNNRWISSLDHVTNNIGISSLDHVSEKASIEY